MNSTKRSPAADIIRILAFFLVCSVHFFLNGGFYLEIVEGKGMYVMTVMRSFAIICVPLFLTLSGYLLRKKQLEKSYYKRIWKIVITYLLASLFCIVYSVFILDDDKTIKDIILSIFNFTAAPYSWYVEMYLGLILLIPFLNIVYNALSSKERKKCLIITFIILTSIPSIINIYDLDSFGRPSLFSMSKLIPAWWENFYPITYYFIGCYLSEYPIKINKALNVALIILCTILSGTFCYWCSYKTRFIWGAWCGYQSLFNIVLTLLVFNLIININYDKMSNGFAKFLKMVSELCFGGYLVSWIFDDKLYPILTEKVPEVTDGLAYYLVIVPAVFILSLLASYVLSKLQSLIESFFSWLCGLFKNKSA